MCDGSSVQGRKGTYWFISDVFPTPLSPRMITYHPRTPWLSVRILVGIDAKAYLEELLSACHNRVRVGLRRGERVGRNEGLRMSRSLRREKVAERDE